MRRALWIGLAVVVVAGCAPSPPPAPEIPGQAVRDGYARCIASYEPTPCR